jgi:hypothetical protein
VNALANLALANFIEMRDKTASRAFRAYKMMDRSLHRLVPRCYTPLYTLVSFTRTPYADAVRKARRQDRFLAATAAAVAALVLALLLHRVWSVPPASSLILSGIVVSAIATIAAKLYARRQASLRAIGARDH